MENNVIWLFGEVDRLLCALIVFIVIEFVTSLFVLIIERKRHKKKWCKKNFFCGCAILTLVIVSNIVDMIIFENGTEIRTAVIYFYLANEGLTIMTNLRRIGLPLPDVLLKVIDQFKKGNISNMV